MCLLMEATGSLAHLFHARALPPYTGVPGSGECGLPGTQRLRTPWCSSATVLHGKAPSDSQHARCSAEKVGSMHSALSLSSAKVRNCPDPLCFPRCSKAKGKRVALLRRQALCLCLKLTATWWTSFALLHVPCTEESTWEPCWVRVTQHLPADYHRDVTVLSPTLWPCGFWPAQG